MTQQPTASATVAGQLAEQLAHIERQCGPAPILGAPAAEPFVITADQARILAATDPATRQLWLLDLVNRWDYERRPVNGVWGSLTNHGDRVWQRAWHKDADAHLARAEAAYARASAGADRARRAA